MNSPNELWGMVRDALDYDLKPCDYTYLVKLNRLFRECVKKGQGADGLKTICAPTPRRKNLPQLGPETCCIRFEFIPTRDLTWRLKLAHKEDRPRRLGCPLVAVEHQGSLYLVDGTKRFNASRDTGTPTEHGVLIISMPPVQAGPSGR